MEWIHYLVLTHLPDMISFDPTSYRYWNTMAPTISNLLEPDHVQVNWKPVSWLVDLLDQPNRRPGPNYFYPIDLHHMIRPTVYLLSLVDENSFHAHNEIISSIIASTITATPSHKWNFRVHKTVRGRRLMEYGKVSFFMDRFFLKSNFKCLGITTWYLSNLFICAGEVFFLQFYLT